MKKITWDKFSSRRESDDEDSDVKSDFPIKALLERNLKYPEDDFNLWMMNTNFVITELDVEYVTAILGVESVDIWSPYRLRIGIGKLFDEDKIKKDIEFILNSSESLQLLTDDTKKEVEELVESFKDEVHWAILILPNGKIITFTNKEDKVFQEKLAFFEEVQEVTGCQLLTS